MEIFCKILLIVMNVNSFVTAYRILESSDVTLANPLSCSQHHFFLIVIKMEQWNVFHVVTININEMTYEAQVWLLEIASILVMPFL